MKKWNQLYLLASFSASFIVRRQESPSNFPQTYQLYTLHLGEQLQKNPSQNFLAVDKRQFWRWFDIVRPAIKRYDFILLRCIRRWLVVAA